MHEEVCFMTLSGKIAVVTGGSRGIGRAVCVRLAALGADVAVNYIGGSAEAAVTKELCVRLGVRAITAEADVADYAACEALFAVTERELGAPDILVNNAGITRDGLILRMTAEDFESVLAVNLKGAFYCTKLACRPMMKKRGGRIINIASVVGITGNAGQANYVASKAGLIGLTKSSARELASRNITVNAIAPGFIETDMTNALSEQIKEKMLESIPLNRLGSPEDVAAAAAFLCGEEAAYITGQVLCVDGGMAM